MTMKSFDVMVFVLQLVLLLSLLYRSDGFYRKEGVERRDYKEGEEIEILVNRLTSEKTIGRIDPYYFSGICHPKTGFWDEYQRHQNLGQFLIGSRIEGSPYKVRVGYDEYCKEVCVSDLGEAESFEYAPYSDIRRLVHLDFHQHFILDNLSAAHVIENDFTTTTRYFNDGVPLGYSNGLTYVYNHLNFIIGYTKQRDGTYNILRFSVQPFSIQHKFSWEIDPDGYDFPVVSRPMIRSCEKHHHHNSHTNSVMARTESNPQLAKDDVLFTYDVIWQRDDMVDWSSRWELYLTMDHAIPEKLHSNAISRSTLLLIFVTCLFLFIVVAKLRQDVSRGYTSLATADMNGQPVLTTRWMLVANHVFRPPTEHPMLLAIFCGSGAQCFVASIVVLFFSCCNILSAPNRGALPHAILLAYVLSGFVGGYVAGRLAETFGVFDLKRITKWTTLMLPGVAWFYFIMVNYIVFLPFRIHVLVLAYIFAIGAPLVFCGAVLAGQHGPIMYPVQPNYAEEARLIPHSSVKVERMALSLGLLTSSIIPFCMCYTEANLILDAVFYNIYYDSFRYLTITWWFMVIATGLLSATFIFFQLCFENYRWWWRSFFIGGSFAIVFFLYSIAFYDWGMPHTKSVGAAMRYFGYMGILCFGLLLTMGFIAVSCSFLFLWFLYARLPSSSSAITRASLATTHHSLSLEDEEGAELVGRYERVQLQRTKLDSVPPSQVELKEPPQVQPEEGIEDAAEMSNLPDQSSKQAVTK